MNINDGVLLDQIRENKINVLPIRAAFVGCSIEDKKLFPNSTCLLSISICGAKAHEGKKFLATIKLLNKSFKACDILIADTVHKHTLRLTYPNASISWLWEKSKKDGDDWLQRNKLTYEKLTIPYNVIRWDECLQLELFPEKLIEVSKLYDEDSIYREAFKINIEEYLIRYKNREKSLKLSYDLAYSYCLQYLKEECAVVCALIEKGYNFEVYPSQRGPALAITYEKLIRPLYPNILKLASIKLKTKTTKTCSG